MSESFLVLLAAGVMLAVLIPDAKDVTVDWMRLGGIIALTMATLSIFFYTRRAEAGAGKVWTIYLLMMGSILFFIAGVHLPIRAIGRPFALCAAVAGTVAGTMLMGRMNGIALVSCAGVAAMSGICLMDMLLGHAYLTASKMSMRSFARIHGGLAVVSAIRAICAVGVAMFLLHYGPIELFWDRFGIFVITRWLVGLVIPAVFIYMAWDCIKRRATQSATGILYVTGILIFIGEIIGLYLLRETRLPF